MSRMHRFVRKAVLSLVVSTAALVGAYLAVSSGQAAAPVDSAARVTNVTSLEDIGWS